MSSAPARQLFIAVTPLVKRLVLESNQGRPLLLSRDHRAPFNPYASYLYALLERQHIRYDDNMGREACQRDLTEQMEVLIPYWQSKYGVGDLITTARQLAFNQFVLHSFRQNLRQEIAVRMETTASIRQAAERTLSRLNIHEEDYPLDAAIRHYRRHQAQ